MAHNHFQRDSIQERLDSVNRRLHHPTFLRTISTSQLPSQAASDTSGSPLEPSSPVGQLARSPLHKAVDVDGVQGGDDLYSPLTVLASDHDVTIHQHTRELRRFQKQFHHAWLAFGTKMASERGFSTFDHEHADLVLAVDFNFYGTRMVTASSDHRLKVWDKKDDGWSLIDSWRAHDAEIVDVSQLAAVSRTVPDIPWTFLSSTSSILAGWVNKVVR
jgi:nucleoporin SEH1